MKFDDAEWKEVLKKCDKDKSGSVPFFNLLYKISHEEFIDFLISTNI